MARNRRQKLSSGQFRLRVYLAAFGLALVLTTIIVTIAVMTGG